MYKWIFGVHLGRGGVLYLESLIWYSPCNNWCSANNDILRHPHIRTILQLSFRNLMRYLAHCQLRKHNFSLIFHPLAFNIYRDTHKQMVVTVNLDMKIRASKSSPFSHPVSKLDAVAPSVIDPPSGNSALLPKFTYFRTSLNIAITIFNFFYLTILQCRIRFQQTFSANNNFPRKDL